MLTASSWIITHCTLTAYHSRRAAVAAHVRVALPGGREAGAEPRGAEDARAAAAAEAVLAGNGAAGGWRRSGGGGGKEG